MSLVPYTLGMDYGAGVDALTGSSLGRAIVDEPPQEIQGVAGQSLQFSVEQIDSVQDLHNALGLTVEAHGSYGLFHASAKVSFAESCGFHEESLFLLVHVTARNAFRQLHDPRLDGPALQLIADGRMQRFREQFGDVFVAGILTGGEYFAVLEVETQSASDQRELRASLEAGGTFGVGSADISAQFSSQLSQVSQRHSVHIHEFQEGGDTHQVTTAPEIVAKAAAFGDSVAGERAVPYAVLLRNYKTLDMPSAPNWVDLENAKEVLEQIWFQRSALMTLLNELDFTILHPEQFEPTTQDLRGAREKVREAINGFTTAASRCANSVTQCAIPALDVPTVQLPRRLDGRPAETGGAPAVPSAPPAGTTRPTTVSVSAILAIAAALHDRVPLSHALFVPHVFVPPH